MHNFNVREKRERWNGRVIKYRRFYTAVKLATRKMEDIKIFSVNE